jgi:hypothetical protein
VLAAASAVGSGSATDTLPAKPSAENRPGLPTTRATYRTLLLKGMAPEEAANLTAYLAGIPIGDSTWTLKQINQLLFFRQMARMGRFGHRDESQPH